MKSLRNSLPTAARLRRFSLNRSCLLVAAGLAGALPGSAAIVFSVTFDDPGGIQSPHYADISAHVNAAGALWAARLTGDADLAVQVSFSGSVATGNGTSATSSFVETQGGFNVFEQGAAAEIHTGTDLNAASPDILITIGTAYLSDNLWFDPTPFDNAEAVPGDRIDALSFFSHEIGHALAFNGWRNATDGSLPGDYMSTWDRHVTYDGSNLFFEGPAAMTVYGGPVPVTFGNSNHLGNNAPRPGTDLIPDLMNGVVFFFGTRYPISELDWAILTDAGLTVVPEPAAVGIGAGLLCAALAAGRRLRS